MLYWNSTYTKRVAGRFYIYLSPYMLKYIFGEVIVDLVFIENSHICVHLNYSTNVDTVINLHVQCQQYMNRVVHSTGLFEMWQLGLISQQYLQLYE